MVRDGIGGRMDGLLGSVGLGGGRRGGLVRNLMFWREESG